MGEKFSSIGGIKGFEAEVTSSTQLTVLVCMNRSVIVLRYFQVRIFDIFCHFS